MIDEFDLNQMIRDTLLRSKEADPHVVARRLVARIPEEHMHAALAVCLHDRVRIIIGQERMAARRTAPGTAGKSWASVAATVLAERRYVPARGGWLRLGEMTAGDCESVAEDAARRAVWNEQVAARFSALADRLRAESAATVADLGDLDLGAVAA